MSEEENSPPPGRRRALWMITLALCVAAGAGAVYWLLYGRWVETTNNAQVAGNKVVVMPQLAGTVVAVQVDDTARVTAGQLLVTLDDTDARVIVEAAEARLGETVLEVARLFADRERAGAAMELAQTELSKARTDLERRRGLIVERAISQEELQHAEDAVAMRSAALTVAVRDRAAAEALVGGATLADHPRVVAAAAELLAAYVALDRTRILAPVAGQVAERVVQVGQQVSIGQRLLTLVPLDDLWVEVNFKEDQLRHLRLGQPVELTTDTYGDAVVFEGRVAGLGAGTGGVFSLLPPQNATGNWIKIVQRLPVRVELVGDAVNAHPLRLGLSMHAVVSTRDRTGPVLAPAGEARVAYRTDIHAARRSQAARRVEVVLDRYLDAADAPRTPSTARMPAQ